MIPAFPKIFAIGQKYINDIFETEVEITEKIDGSQFSFGKIDGEIICRSRGKIQDEGNVDKLFNIAVDYVHSISNILPEDLIFYCEYLKKPKHNTLCYERVPKNHLILFAIAGLDGTFFPERDKYAKLLEIEPVPIIYKGIIKSVEELTVLLNRTSVLGRSKIEGIVVKNYNKVVLLGDQVLPIMSGKYVSEEFKEVHQRTWKRENTSKGRFEDFKEGFRTEARWQKAVNWLKDNGELDESPKDIGKLMKRVNTDIAEEEKENIKEFLWKEFGKDVLRHATRGLPEWYKKQIMQNPFEEVDKDE